ncbi:hypothetical protein J416_15602 [Gracilibacillus halophilus YIM-C55.5]|uniref:Uncharacterized protein n=1 Tax=Gracilibacillus halophilus YIM-C55.5 TaxID=1308866 RepID=N4WQP9_9BACI|nr:hypothetical protein [Gracilibacillus halophilus]ENH95531.1 hypothetical protein J416_15602 [Gracilibacillus halophilus YIM-C55.5]
MNWAYTLYAVLLAILSIITGEIVTFVMLGIILITLHNIQNTLKELLELKKRESDDNNQ